MSNKNLKIAIIGGTGLVGKTLLQVLWDHKMPFKNLHIAASEKSVGVEIPFKDYNFEVKSIEEVLELAPDVALFSAGGDISKEWAPKFTQKGIYVIDNSSAWRMDSGVKLVIPEINGKSLTESDKLIANPNCSTIQLAMILHPLHRQYGLSRVVVSTYQSVTGSGNKAVSQLSKERKGEEVKEKAYPHPIDMNCLPHCDDFMDNGYTKEELKVINETRKILRENELPITATAVRVPVTGGHSESVNIELEKDFKLDGLRNVLKSFPGVKLVDHPEKNEYPMPITAKDHDEVFVGRIRKDNTRPNALNLWVVADNLRKGAATNAVQILKQLMENKILK